MLLLHKRLHLPKALGPLITDHSLAVPVSLAKTCICSICALLTCMRPMNCTSPSMYYCNFLRFVFGGTRATLLNTLLFNSHFLAAYAMCFAGKVCGLVQSG